jgi:site-specific DNA-cytosine methylase
MRMSYTVVDVNGLNAAQPLGMVKAGAKLLYRTGYLDLGRSIVNANHDLWGPDWEDHIDPKAVHDHEGWFGPGGRLNQGDYIQADIVTATPPCSGFSVMTGKAGSAKGTGKAMQRHAEHPSNDCMWSSARYAARHAPEIYMFESVTGAFKLGQHIMQGLRAELERISGEPYTLTHWLHDGAVMGAPTSRQRYMFVAVKGNTPFSVIPADEYAVTDFVPMWDAIKDLRDLKLQMPDQKIRKSAAPWGAERHRADGMVDGMGNYVGVWQRRLESTGRELEQLGSRWPEGTGHGEAMRMLYQIGGDAPLRRALESDTLTDRMIANGFNLGPYASKRESRTAMNSLIAGGGTGGHFHPTENRLLTYRELARIQGWPDDLRINFDTSVYGKESLDAVWGKAVGCLVGEHAGHAAIDWLDGKRTGHTHGELIGDREYLVDELDHSRRLRRDNQAEKKRARALAGSVR